MRRKQSARKSTSYGTFGAPFFRRKLAAGEEDQPDAGPCFIHHQNVHRHAVLHSCTLPLPVTRSRPSL